MGKHGSARAVLVGAVLAGAAIIALAGCTGVGTATAPDVPGEAAGSTSTAGTGPASSPRQSVTPGASTGQSATSVNGTRQNATSKAFVKADSIPFPVAVGNTWVYQTMAGSATGRTTNRIVSAGSGPAAYQVTVSSTTDVAGPGAAQPVYRFYPDGTIGYPVPPGSGLSVTGGSVRWPDAAGLASGQAYHSVLRVQDSQTGQYENANVTVQGGGTAYVVVPDGAYQASVVHMTIAAKTVTVEVTTWIAQGIGPVKTEVLVHAAGQAQRSTTYELLSFTKAISIVGDGS